MNREEVLATTPGRKLDCLVAEFVLGFKRTKTPEDYNGQNGGTDVLIPPDMDSFPNYPPMGKIALGYFANDYSTDLSAAWEVVEKMRADGFELSLNDYSDNGYQVFFVGNNQKQPTATTETAPEAISKAALLAVMEG